MPRKPLFVKANLSEMHAWLTLGFQYDLQVMHSYLNKIDRPFEDFYIQLIWYFLQCNYFKLISPRNSDLFLRRVMNLFFFNIPF